MLDTVASALERETNHLWWLGTNLTQAIASGDRSRADEFMEGLAFLAELTEYASIRIKAASLINQAQLVGPSDLVAFKVAEATVSTAKPIANRILPVTYASLAAIVAACSLVTSPSLTDPPAYHTASVVDESILCIDEVDHCG